MAIVWFLAGVIAGVLAGAFLLVQSLIVVFFGIPFAARLREKGALLSWAPVRRYVVSLLLLLGLFAVVTWAVWHFAPGKSGWGYALGLAMTVLPGLGHCGPTANNVSDFMESNGEFIDPSALSRAS